MKILVCVKRVVDYNVKVHPKADGSAVELANLKMSMNPFDEIAVEEAVRLKEKNHASEIIVVSIGNEKAQEVLRTALAMGADRAVLIKTDAETQPLSAAKLLKYLVNKESPALVILGKQAIDDDANQTGQMLAGLLQWPQATFASEIVVGQQNLRVTREIDGGLEVLDVTLPAVVTTDLRLNEPRYPALPNIMKARAKPLEIIEAQNFSDDIAPKLRLLKVQYPAKRKAGQKIANVDELLSELKSKGIIA
jgi:electron transfer flavoprotein beta subunit